MSDVDALRARLVAAREAARTADEVCAAVADVEWFNAHGEAAPEHPTPAALAAWLPECPPDQQAEAAELLAALFGAPAHWDAVTYNGELQPAAIVIQTKPQPGMLAVQNRDGTWHGAVLQTLANVHAVWLSADPRPRHPLAPLVDALQRRPPYLAGATATVTRNRTNMTRRVQVVSTVRRVGWTLDAEVAGAVVER